MFKIAPYLNRGVRGVRGERGKGYVNFYIAFPKRCVREEKHSLHSASSVASAPSVIQTTRESTSPKKTENKMAMIRKLPN